MNAIDKREKTYNEVESARGFYFRTPDTDIFESKDEYKLIFDIPGIEKEDISVKVEKGILTLTAETKNTPCEGYECISEEISYDGYKRSFNLNNSVDTDKIETDYVNGSLTLKLPKKEEHKTKEIKISIS